jgi:hypothetical protein
MEFNNQSRRKYSSLEAGSILKRNAQFQFIQFLIALYVSLSILSCKKFTQVKVPKTQIVSEVVFSNDATAISSINGIYSQMSNFGFASGDVLSATYLTGLSSDEWNLYSNQQSVIEFYKSDLSPTNSTLSSSLWAAPYQYIFAANSILEGLKNSTGLSVAIKRQLEGEAKFIRSFCHFYLVNLYGDVPYISTTDYRTNALVFRTPVEQVYKQIIADLKDAQSLLPMDFIFSVGERVRPNYGAATAMLARSYLFIGDWVNAELQATEIINNTGVYSLVADLNKVFIKNSKEAIWQLTPVVPGRNTWEANTFIITGIPNNAALSNVLLNAFELGDSRKINWINSITVGTTTYYYPYKYKINTIGQPLTEYSMVIRLAELYLIRSEARTRQNNLIGGQLDLNIIRNRAGLSNTPVNNQDSLIVAIEHEREVELFTEWGHRWLDLKRYNRANTILGAIKPGWQSTDVLYPIPQIQIQNDFNITQNPGY